jgi:hypothetical protein
VHPADVLPPADVSDVDAGADDVLDAGASTLEHRDDAAQRLTGLLGHVAAAHGAPAVRAAVVPETKTDRPTRTARE